MSGKYEYDEEYWSDISDAGKDFDSHDMTPDLLRNTEYCSIFSQRPDRQNADLQSLQADNSIRSAKASMDH